MDSYFLSHSQRSDNTKKLRRAYHGSHNSLTCLGDSHWWGLGLRYPTDLRVGPSPAACRDVTLHLVFMEIPCLSKACVGMNEILCLRAGAS